MVNDNFLNRSAYRTAPTVTIHYAQNNNPATNDDDWLICTFDISNVNNNLCVKVDQKFPCLLPGIPTFPVPTLFASINNNDELKRALIKLPNYDPLALSPTPLVHPIIASIIIVPKNAAIYNRHFIAALTRPTVLGRPAQLKLDDVPVALPGINPSPPITSYTDLQPQLWDNISTFCTPQYYGFPSLRMELIYQEEKSKVKLLILSKKFIYLSHIDLSVAIATLQNNNFVELATRGIYKAHCIASNNLLFTVTSQAELTIYDLDEENIIKQVKLLPDLFDDMNEAKVCAISTIEIPQLPGKRNVKGTYLIAVSCNNVFTTYVCTIYRTALPLEIEAVDNNILGAPFPSSIYFLYLSKHREVIYLFASIGKDVKSYCLQF